MGSHKKIFSIDFLNLLMYIIISHREMKRQYLLISKETMKSEDFKKLEILKEPIELLREVMDVAFDALSVDLRERIIKECEDFDELEEKINETTNT